MSNLECLLKISFCLFSLTCAVSANAGRYLYSRFKNPDNDCRTKLWWFHGETETTKEGIRKDLEEFKEKGIGGVVFYDQVHGKAEDACLSKSSEWWQMLKYAALIAKELRPRLKKWQWLGPKLNPWESAFIVSRNSEMQ